MKTIDEQAREAVAQANRENEAGYEAATVAFPGATADVFALDPDIKVGSYRVRPCYDYDLRVLELNNHPVYKRIMARALGLQVNENAVPFMPMDSNGHLLAWLFTTDVKEAKARIQAEGYAAVVKAADEQFEFCQPKVCIALCGAAADQIAKGMESRLSYRPAKVGKEGAEADLPPSEAPSTASAG